MRRESSAQRQAWTEYFDGQAAAEPTNKMGNKRTFALDRWFDSKWEAEYAVRLDTLNRFGKIRDPVRQRAQVLSNTPALGNEEPGGRQQKARQEARMLDLAQLPPLTKRCSTEYWDGSLDYNLAGERAARLEREDQLRTARQHVVELRRVMLAIKSKEAESLIELLDNFSVKVEMPPWTKDIDAALAATADYGE